MQTLTGWRTGFYLSQIKFFDGGFRRCSSKYNANKKVADKIPQPFALTIVILVGGEARTPFFRVSIY